MRVYIAGPYTGKTHDHNSYFQIDRNILTAMEAAAELARYGIEFFCPHTHSAHFEVITPDVPPDFWYNLDVAFMDACDAILMLPGWEESRGARAENKLALEKGMLVFYNVAAVVDYEFEARLTKGLMETSPAAGEPTLGWTLAAHIERLHKDHEAGKHKHYEQGCSLCEARDAEAQRMNRKPWEGIPFTGDVPLQ